VRSLSDRFDVEGRAVIVTGGAGMLGTRYAQALSEAGAHVVVADLDGDRAEKVVAELAGARSLAVRADVSDPSSVRDMVRQALDAFGEIDGLVNNAALDPKADPSHADENRVLFEDYPLEQWNRHLAVDLTGAFLCAQAVARPMLDRGKGSIVNVSSIYGVVGPDPRLYRDEGSRDTEPPFVKPVAYSVTKAALIGLTRYLAAYWGGSGIRVNALVPGGVRAGQDEGFVRRYSARTPLGRMAEPDEYCAALLFLLSDASAYMTGSDLVVDGGWTAW
jgi:NAD(P)-dependent dehydrogenase (short-subunit alcohol dehydrogenase family)